MKIIYVIPKPRRKFQLFSRIKNRNRNTFLASIDPLEELLFYYNPENDL